ncbi:MAG TPA: NosD domain-containing protein, partial [Candidatus Methylomirabilis sp.]|nr:NosD domain-containing protein [Candidatus Methylomirabilis sp.]
NGYRFIGLDSGYDFNAKGGNFEDKWLYDNTPEGSGLDDTQRSFLFSAAGASDNNINSKLPKIVFMHHPVIDVKDDSTFDERYPPVKNEDNTYGGNDGTIAKNRVELIKLSEQYNIPLVLTGHSHKPKFLDSKANLNSRNPKINTEYHFPDFSVANSDISIGLIPNKYPIFVQERSATKDDDSSHGYLVVNVEKNNIFLEDRIVTRKAAPYYTSNTFSPADVHVYDQFGRHTGLNATGQIETNIPDSYYFEEEKLGNITIPATILLYNRTLNYTTKIVSNFSKENITGEQSNFTFTMDKQIGNETITITYDNVSINRNTTTHLQLNSTETNYAMQVDFNNDTTNITPRAPDSIITNYAPTAIISSPANNSTWQQGEAVIFNGTGIDIEDGILNETTWISDRDDVIGHGNFTTANLSAGIHRITMRMNDSAGQINTSSIVLIINDTMPPVVEISNPPENKTFNKQNITVIGIAYDDSGISNVTVNGIQAGQENWNTSLGLNEGENRIEVVATDNKGFSKTANRTVYYNSSLATDTQPPATITNLTHETGYNSVNGAWINWTWDNPKDTDFSYAIVHLDNISMGNTSRSYFNFTGLSSDADYNISIVTADIVDNINYSEVKDTVRTPLLDATPPQSINNPSLQEAGTTWLTFTWLNPNDPNYDHSILYLNGIFKTNITAPQNYYNFTGLQPDTLYELGTHTVDRSGNVNETWVNATARTAPNRSIIITVNDSGGADYTRIQDAIDNASVGDTIEVQSGTYYENVNVNKQLTLRSIGMPVVNASGNGSAFTLAVDGIMLEGFTATGSGNYESGIIVASNNNILIGNNANSNKYYGIYLSSSNNNMLSGNNALNNYYGIQLSSSSNNTLIGNNASSNTADGIFLSYSSNNTLISNNASNNGWRGIGIDYSSSNMLNGNNASNNHLQGIFVYSSSNNTLSGNNATSNINYGLYLYDSSNNTIYNNIFNNTKNFYNDLNTNKWNVTKTLGMNIISGPSIGGNFWANPGGSGFSQTCTDVDKDGICSLPYILDANNIDYLPLAWFGIAEPLPAIRYINGTVKDNSTGNNLTGVTVSANSTLTTTTSATGFYSFAVTEGTYNLTATFDITYYTNITTVSTIGKAVASQDIGLVKKPTGNITGSVTKCCTLG